MAVNKTAMRDGAPCHRSKVVSEYLWTNQMKVLDWPRNSPNRKPTENLWSYMKNYAAEKQQSCDKEFVTAIKKI